MKLADLDMAQGLYSEAVDLLKGLSPFNLKYPGSRKIDESA